jgi:O-antigen/teichoic acid export membrane protein
MRTKSSVLNFIVKLISSIVPSLLGIILNNLIITTYGSDVNGVIGTVNQVINLLMLFEGGFTMATNVALYKPYLENDVTKINELLSMTRIIFVRLGYIFLILSLIISFIAPIFIKSDIDHNVISGLFIIAALNLCIQFFCTAKYNIMFAVAQKEYITGIILLILNVITQIVSIVLVESKAHIIVIKALALILSITSIPIIIKYFHNNFPELHFQSKAHNYGIIRTTADVITQKFASLVYNSTAMILISIFISAKLSSVYLVYNLIFSFIKSILFSLILAPFNAFGQLYAEGSKERLQHYYKIYQFITVTALSIFITITNILILPFIELYTRGVKDINYLEGSYVILFSLCCVFELISNILGCLSNSTGIFREMRKIALYGALINIITSFFLVKPFGIRGVLIGSIIGYVYMVSSQMYLVHIKILGNGLRYFIKIILFNASISYALLKLSTFLKLYFNNYVEFVLYSIIISVIIVISISLVNILCNIKLTKECVNKVKDVFCIYAKKET